MASLIEISKTGVCLLFNTPYLASSGYFAFVCLMLMVGQSQLTTGQIGSTLTVALPLTAAAGVLVILVSIFGFYSLAFSSKAGMVRTYAIFLFISLIVQCAAMLLVLQKGDELTWKLLKYKELPDFQKNLNDLTHAIQHIQQNHTCCGVETYQDYFGNATGLNPEEKKALIPDSCCGRYNRGYNEHHNSGKCEFEEFSKRNGCGAKLVKAYNRLYGGYNYGYGYPKSRFGLIIYQSVQLAAIGICLILANRMSYYKT